MPLCVCVCVCAWHVCVLVVGRVRVVVSGCRGVSVCTHARVLVSSHYICVCGCVCSGGSVSLQVQKGVWPLARREATAQCLCPASDGVCVGHSLGLCLRARVSRVYVYVRVCQRESEWVSESLSLSLSLCVCVFVCVCLQKGAQPHALPHLLLLSYGLTRFVSDQCSALFVYLFVSLQSCVCFGWLLTYCLPSCDLNIQCLFITLMVCVYPGRSTQSGDDNRGMSLRLKCHVGARSFFPDPYAVKGLGWARIAQGCLGILEATGRCKPLALCLPFSLQKSLLWRHAHVALCLTYCRTKFLILRDGLGACCGVLHASLPV